MKNIVIYENEKSYSAFPDIEHLQNGDLVVAFREAVRRRMRTHLDTTSKAVLLRSTDGGKTWGTKVTIYNDECGIQDPSLVQLKDGTLVANFFK
ncbi:MAG: exo-alpha-sialidase [Candidatus Latescibacteria bacterium]|nr:exo-alpha-sialidase [Candidatus Latescibacterota bacterium]